MKGLRYVYSQDGQFWLGYLEEYPDYMTQGESLEDLRAHLRDLFADLSGGEVRAARSQNLEVRVMREPKPDRRAEDGQILTPSS